MSKLTPQQLRQRRYAYARALQQRAGVVADHRPADAVVIRLCADLQVARRVQVRVPAIAAPARLFERLAWKNLIEYLLTLDCDPQV